MIDINPNRSTNTLFPLFKIIQIALPDDKFARVSFHTGGLPEQHAFGKKEPEQHFDVDPTPSATQYE